MPMVDIRYQDESFMRQLSEMDSKLRGKVLRRVVNRVASDARKDFVAMAMDEYTPRKKAVFSKAAKVIRARADPDSVTAMVRFSSSPISIMEFGAKQIYSRSSSGKKGGRTGAGIEARIGGKNVRFKNAFLAAAHGSGKRMPFERKGADRLPIKSMFSLSAAGAINGKTMGGKFIQSIEDRMNEEVSKEVAGVVP